MADWKEPIDLNLEPMEVDWNKVVDKDTRVDPKDAIYMVVDNLYILPADMSFELYDDWIKDQF